jgi:hypothetical protein
MTRMRPSSDAFLNLSWYGAWRNKAIAPYDRQRPLRVKGCHRDHVGVTTGLRRKAADLLRGPSRQSAHRHPGLHARSAGSARPRPTAELGHRTNPLPREKAAGRWPSAPRGATS